MKVIVHTMTHLLTKSLSILFHLMFEIQLCATYSLTSWDLGQKTYHLSGCSVECHRHHQMDFLSQHLQSVKQSLQSLHNSHIAKLLLQVRFRHQ